MLLVKYMINAVSNPQDVIKRIKYFSGRKKIFSNVYTFLKSGQICVESFQSV